ncbi:MAG: GGDEF domain-containing protein [Lachnospiraceae bacterium]|nr:GGDEF domain-containing protein [Lachnospiraceae bacterium]
MGRRKRIGLFVSLPEMAYVRRITEGIMRQCETYDYDLCIFAACTHLSFTGTRYVLGEANIFELANLDELDGVILDYTSLSGDKDQRSLKRLVERLKNYPDLPACSLEIPIEGTKVIPSDNGDVLREIVRHVVKVHGRKKICILTGTKDSGVAEERLGIFLDELGKYGITVMPEHIVYGDFWYFSGEKLAGRISSGEIPRPDAIICASDTMAIGVTETLIRNGIRVPEEIVVTGFDSTDEAAINPTTLTSWEPADMKMGANAVDHLRALIEPEADIIPFVSETSQLFHPGASCGCQPDPSYVMRRFREALYISSYNYSDRMSGQRISIGTLLESYALEGFTAAGTAEECMESIYDKISLLKPYDRFSLCLKENWLDIDDERVEGYPDHMNIVVSRDETDENSFWKEEDSVRFSTACMFPDLEKTREQASVFWFSPVHFDGKLLGFAVLQRELASRYLLNNVYRNWLRYINSALEMIRSKERLEMLSVRDEMTGAYNRRGMYSKFRRMLSKAKPEDALFVAVVDMDGLKFINDNYGHAEGDFGICAVCEVLRSVGRKGEICVRSGGDEFFLIGIGDYRKSDEAERANEFTKAIEARSEKEGKAYKISASIGCVVCEDCRKQDLDSALSEADGRMYGYKMRNRRQRGI